jgi:hypothetical protein
MNCEPASDPIWPVWLALPKPLVSLAVSRDSINAWSTQLCVAWKGLRGDYGYRYEPTGSRGLGGQERDRRSEERFLSFRGVFSAHSGQVSNQGSSDFEGLHSLRARCGTQGLRVDLEPIQAFSNGVSRTLRATSLFHPGVQPGKDGRKTLFGSGRLGVQSAAREAASSREKCSGAPSAEWHPGLRSCCRPKAAWTHTRADGRGFESRGQNGTAKKTEDLRELLGFMDDYVVAPQEEKWLQTRLAALQNQKPADLIAEGKLRDLIVEFLRLREGQPL